MHPARSSDFHWLLAPVLALAAVVTAAQPADDRGFDPTGVWRGQHGSLVLMRAGDTLSFSYSAVFGATVHLCDGIGVAGFVGDGVWQSVDTEGTVTFATRDGEVIPFPYRFKFSKADRMKG